ncbi:MAG: heavy-metal-associated domain-containing protein [Okeania sp. SIO3I5]|uniref:heavy-metal-associated domain-containing protein n=1 Tax=Okeania sp. SIO3I5 TaxID=2607805 RepID=UPI0013B65024|nr:heavy-metal-associated domain-containing protein [Okeania sp. SIO3I5]NEQ37598.1 heavy-metal-associated domain-containing protein [Okeania sp. SIO3I5]
MAMQLKVSSIACSGCADTITKAIKNLESEADVQVDVEQKLVTVETKASEESIKQVITDAGHTVDNG